MLWIDRVREQRRNVQQRVRVVSVEVHGSEASRVLRAGRIVHDVRAATERLLSAQFAQR
jgi:hypothetical protein